jgi:hypothetical protein
MGNLRVHEYFTNDFLSLSETIKGIGTKEMIGNTAQLQNFWEIEEENEDWKSLRKQEKRYEILNFSHTLKKLAQSLRYIQGTKHVILFSNGLPSKIIYGSPSLRDSYEWGDSALREVFESTAKEFSNANSIIYSVNIEGVPDSFSLSLWVAESGEHSLLRLSQITGGKYYPNTEDLRPAVEDIAKRTSFYYVIGIPVKEEMDGKFHRIEVKVRRKGVRVHAPSGYYNPKPFKEYTEFEKFLHLVDSALSEKPLFGEVKEFPLSLNLIDREKNIFELSFDILKEDYKGEEGEVFTIFFDSKKEIIKVGRERFRLGEDAESFSYKRVIEIPSEAEEIRVVIRDLQNGRAMRGVVKLRL